MSSRGTAVPSMGAKTLEEQVPEWEPKEDEEPMRIFNSLAELEAFMNKTKAEVEAYTAEPIPKPRRVARDEQLKPLSLREIVGLEPPRWRINGLLPQEGLVVLFGAPKTLKSFVAIDWALSVATGSRWLGHDTEACDVIYVAAEGVGGLGRRCAAWLAARNLTLDDVPRFRVVRCPVDMTDGKEVDRLIRAIQSTELSPRLIVLDTVSRCFGGKDTYQQQDMSRFVSGCDKLRDEFQATVLAIHHCAKAKSKNTSPLGSVALAGAADAMFLTERADKSPQLTVRNVNQKEAEEHRDIHLVLVSEGESCVLWADREMNGSEEEKGDKPDQKTPQRRLAMLEALEKRGDSGATSKEWRMASGLGSNTKAFNEIRKALLESGEVRKDAETERYFFVGGGETGANAT
jgi:hypothetical protein